MSIYTFWLNNPINAVRKYLNLKLMEKTSPIHFNPIQVPRSFCAFAPSLFQPAPGAEPVQLKRGRRRRCPNTHPILMNQLICLAVHVLFMVSRRGSSAAQPPPPPDRLGNLKVNGLVKVLWWCILVPGNETLCSDDRGAFLKWMCMRVSRSPADKLLSPRINE